MIVAFCSSLFRVAKLKRIISLEFIIKFPEKKNRKFYKNLGKEITKFLRKNFQKLFFILCLVNNGTNQNM